MRLVTDSTLLAIPDIPQAVWAVSQMLWIVRSTTLQAERVLNAIQPNAQNSRAAAVINQFAAGPDASPAPADSTISLK